MCVCGSLSPSETSSWRVPSKTLSKSKPALRQLAIDNIIDGRGMRRTFRKPDTRAAASSPGRSSTVRTPLSVRRHRRRLGATPTKVSGRYAVSPAHVTPKRGRGPPVVAVEEEVVSPHMSERGGRAAGGTPTPAAGNRRRVQPQRTPAHMHLGVCNQDGGSSSDDDDSDADTVASLRNTAPECPVGQFLRRSSVHAPPSLPKTMKKSRRMTVDNVTELLSAADLAKLAQRTPQAICTAFATSFRKFRARRATKRVMWKRRHQPTKLTPVAKDVADHVRCQRFCDCSQCFVVASSHVERECCCVSLCVCVCVCVCSVTSKHHHAAELLHQVLPVRGLM